MQLRWEFPSATRDIDRLASGTLNVRLLPLQTAKTSNFGTPTMMTRCLYSSENPGSRLTHGYLRILTHSSIRQAANQCPLVEA